MFFAHHIVKIARFKHGATLNICPEFVAHKALNGFVNMKKNKFLKW